MNKPWVFIARFGQRVRSDEEFAIHRKVAGAVLFLLVLGALMWAVQGVPEWQVRRASVRSAEAYPEARTTPADVAALQNEMRRTFIQIVGGVFALLALYLTYRRVKVAEQGHITDRYTKAIEQLGATREDRPNVEVRLGAIYALERIAKDSARDHWTIMEVLTAYVRQNAPAPANEPTRKENETAIARRPSTEIQAILTVLGRRKRDRKREKNGQSLDLGRSDLRGASFTNAHFEGAVFHMAHLNEALFYNAHLEGALFLTAHLEGSVFYRSHLDGAHFRWAYLDGTNFRDALGLVAAQFAGVRGLRRAVFDEALSEGLGSAEAQDSG